MTLWHSHNYGFIIVFTCLFLFKLTYEWTCVTGDDNKRNVFQHFRVDTLVVRRQDKIPSVIKIFIGLFLVLVVGKSKTCWKLSCLWCFNIFHIYLIDSKKFFNVLKDRNIVESFVIFSMIFTTELNMFQIYDIEGHTKIISVCRRNLYVYPKPSYVFFDNVTNEDPLSLSFSLSPVTLNGRKIGKYYKFWQVTLYSRTMYHLRFTNDIFMYIFTSV